MTIFVVSIVTGYLLLIWSIRQIRMNARKAEAAAVRDRLHLAIETKYSVPLMTEAQIAEMHASRWQGD